MFNKCNICGKDLSTADGYGFQTGLCTTCYWEKHKITTSDNTRDIRLNLDCVHCMDSGCSKCPPPENKLEGDTND